MESKPILSRMDISRALERLAYEILERHGSCDRLQLVGIERRGADLAKRMQGILQQKLGRDIPLNTLDINLYRDDWTNMTNRPAVGPSHMMNAVDKATILLVDDVLYTGRTIRSAMEAIMDYGRPDKIELLVLVDRGRRELPIQPDYTGRSLSTAASERVDVFLEERDGKDEVVLSRN